MIQRHADYTGSQRAAMLLDRWDEMVSKFVKVLPRDYARMLQSIERVKASGLSGDEAAHGRV